MAKNLKGQIKSIEKISIDTYKMDIQSELEDVKAGQFVSILCPNKTLRRPFSVADFEKGTFSVLFKLKGDGTKYLSSLKKGDTVDFIAPLGNGFKIELIGENHIGQIISWGAMYGGSITFTGSGSLVVNENLDYTEGVKLNAETSKSAIMFDRYADVLIYGGETPILVNDSLLSKTVYYLSPITEEDGLNYVHYK